MERRAFLKTLVALGVAITLPVDLTAASPAEIDQAWTATSSHWGLFEVNDYGTLSFANFEGPRTRRDAYDLPEAAKITANDIECCGPLNQHLECYFDDLVADHEEALIAAGVDPDTGWRAWYESASDEARAEVTRSIDAWLDEEPDWSNEWEDLCATGDAQGAAYYYLRTQDWDVLDALSIKIIEGEHPGSTYFAAELRIDPDEANAIAERLGLEMRFVREGA
jgi:hypothetical protein